MNLSIRQAGGEALVFTGEADEAMRPYLIPGSKVSAAGGGFGKLLLQEIEFDGYSLLYSVLDARQDGSFIVSSFESILLCHIITAGRWAFEIKNTGDFKLKPGQFCLFFNRFLHAGFYFRKGHVYKAVTIDYPAPVFLQAIKRYPLLQPFESHILKQAAFNAGSTKPIQSAKALQCINTLLHAPFAETIKAFHTSVLHKLLFLLLRQISHESKAGAPISLDNIDKIFSAKAFIDEHLPRHFPTAQIARKTGMNEQQLKRGFKAVFGKGVYGYYQEQVLAFARKELEETDEPVKAIALRAGYKNTRSFSAAFARKFRCSPSAWQRINARRDT